VIDWADFEKVDMRVGVVVDTQEFPEARRPAYKLWIDFG
jgi:tRNA-binding protein